MQPTSPGRGEFARLLADLQRDTPGLSYQKLADAAGVHRSQVWRWVNAGSAPGYEPVRRLAAWLTGQYPHLAGAAARLLPAAGYGDPDDPTLPGVVPAPDPAATRAGQALASVYAQIAGEVHAEIDAARRRGTPEDRIFTDTYEQALWAIPLVPETGRVLRIAVLRFMRPDPAAAPRNTTATTNSPPAELAGLAAWGAAHATAESCRPAATVPSCDLTTQGELPQTPAALSSFT